MYRQSFSPVAQRFILKEKHLHDKGDSFRFLVDTDIYWHWSILKDDLYQNIINNYDELLKSDFKLFKDFNNESDKINENQPSGKLFTLEDFHDNGFDEYRDENKPKSEFDKKWRMELYGYYAPAHFHDKDSYGIYLVKQGIAQMIKSIHSVIPKEPFEVILLCSVFKIYAHELCHAWIEDIVTLLDFHQGEKGDLSERNYSKTNKKFNSYIYLEESLCNTVAYGMLYKFLNGKGSGSKDSEIPKFNPDEILKAFEGFMRKQPKGYKDFHTIKEYPYESEIFIFNLVRLIIDVYGYNFYGKSFRDGLRRYTNKGKINRDYVFDHCHIDIIKVISNYFGYDYSHGINIKRLNFWDSLWSNDLRTTIIDK